ncbi:MAG: osmotically inducible protein C [Rhodobacteraceae bacterium]|nr:osmotically inducible protein C [Paracoccaceae bacterium]
MPSERVTFVGHDGSRLDARLDRPPGPVLATALFAHCFSCSKDIPAARRIAGKLASIGFAVLRFDFTGLGDSGGEFANTTFRSNVEDLVLAARYLESRDMAPALLIGHSLGGAAVIRARARIPSIRAVATLGAPADPSHVIDRFAHRVDAILDRGRAEVDLAGRTFCIGAHFLEDISQVNLDDALHDLRAALLILHAPRDQTVGIDNASHLFNAAMHPKSFVTLDDADHLITRAQDAEYAATVIAAWAARYLELRPPAPPPGAPEGIVRMPEADPKDFPQDVAWGPDHPMVADEPEAYGGTNRGPSPYGLLAAGLGACTSMTIRIYARRRAWALENVVVVVTHDKVHAQDAKPGSTAKVDHFTRLIRLEGALDGDQRARLLEIADKWPVHRTLEQGALVETRLV